MKIKNSITEQISEIHRITGLTVERCTDSQEHINIDLEYKIERFKVFETTAEAVQFAIILNNLKKINWKLVTND